MSTPGPELPPHLYSDIHDQEGNVTGQELDAVRLLAWANHGRGNSVDNYCNSLLERELENIETWQERQLLLIDEQWQEHGDEEDESTEQACDTASATVLNEAGRRRSLATAHNRDRQTAILKLVQEAEAYVEARRPAEDEDTSMGMMILLMAAGALLFMALV